MFKNWGSWLGIESTSGQNIQVEETCGSDQDAEKSEVNKHESSEEMTENQAILQQAKDLSGYILNFASSATKKISESVDKRNFLRDPPAGVQFHFDVEQMYPVALVMLQEDELLNRMRFDLVPKHVKEEVFWRNYFYRVSLIKQSAQLTALAAQQQAADRRDDKNGDDPQSENASESRRPKTPPTTINSKPKPTEHHEEEEISTSPGVSEFVSDAFDSCNINQEDLRKEMEQLVLDKKNEDEDASEWERELQRELQEYEVVAEADNRDENWDREIEEMLQAD
ncbi:Synapse-associated protein 1 [Bagarius yarrelli]|uniref:Synapse-associated protein 1 n=1 Tax=Bagarius yarrelli TaxID=175774 RepID=A0A556U081_BAGYA|nr:Synapse-associated protein 1 [Bagarius yarrelli]